MKILILIEYVAMFCIIILVSTLIRSSIEYGNNVHAVFVSTNYCYNILLILPQLIFHEIKSSKQWKWNSLNWIWIVAAFDGMKIVVGYRPEAHAAHSLPSILNNWFQFIPAEDCCCPRRRTNANWINESERMKWIEWNGLFVGRETYNHSPRN